MAMIKTSHVGSLPRGDELTPLLLARDKGEAYDAEAFDAAVAAAVDAAVAKQVEAGVSVVSDGELGKVGYSTYMIERLSGFGGHIDRKPAADLAEVPELSKKLSAIMGSQEFVRASCIGDVRLVSLQPLHDDIRRVRAALDKNAAPDTEAFMNAASPGLITAFQVNRHYPSHEAYLADLADAMREEYETIVNAGFYLQLDCPDLAMSRHTGYQDMSEADFLKVAAANVEALNAATANIPPEKMRMHVCWGNYEGPHCCDVEMGVILPTLLAAKPVGLLFETSNPRHQADWTYFAEIASTIPEDKILIPGVIDSTTNFVEHPRVVAERIERFAGIIGRERVIAGTDCGFSTFAGFGVVDPDIVWAKFEALAEGAEIASSRLWKRAA